MSEPTPIQKIELIRRIVRERRVEATLLRPIETTLLSSSERVQEQIELGLEILEVIARQLELRPNAKDAWTLVLDPDQLSHLVGLICGDILLKSVYEVEPEDAEPDA